MYIYVDLEFGDVCVHELLKRHEEHFEKSLFSEIFSFTLPLQQIHNSSSQTGAMYNSSPCPLPTSRRRLPFRSSKVSKMRRRSTSSFPKTLSSGRTLAWKQSKECFITALRSWRTLLQRGSSPQTDSPVIG